MSKKSEKKIAPKDLYRLDLIEVVEPELSKAELDKAARKFLKETLETRPEE